MAPHLQVGNRVTVRLPPSTHAPCRNEDVAHRAGHAMIPRSMNHVAACQILGVSIDASHVEIRVAFRRLVKLSHPDKFHSDPNQHADAEERMKRINAAFEFLHKNPRPSPREAQTKRPAPPSPPPPSPPPRRPPRTARTDHSKQHTAPRVGRVDLKVPVELRLKDGHISSGFTRDISRDGLSIILDNAPSSRLIRKNMTVSFGLPGVTRPISGEVFCIMEGRREIWLLFKSFASHNREAIESFVSANQHADLIVGCPRCGAYNRVKRRPRTPNVRCSRCKTGLSI
jgi:hypothetical protein